MSKAFFLVVGASGAGKTTITEALNDRYGLKPIVSYTTRPPRYAGEVGHVFVDDATFPQMDELVAYTRYNGYQYGSTQCDVENSDLYVIDVPGIEYFKAHYRGNKRYYIVQIDAPEAERYKRMVARGNTAKEAQERIDYDKVAFAEVKPDALFINNDVELCIAQFYQYYCEKREEND